jgi:hypothetical protein
VEAAGLAGAGPVLAHEGALVAALERVGAGEAEAVAGGDEDGGGGVAAEEAGDAGLLGVLAGVVEDLPVGGGGGGERGWRAGR